jgi:hypothetical protein
MVPVQLGYREARRAEKSNPKHYAPPTFKAGAIPMMTLLSVLSHPNGAHCPLHPFFAWEWAPGDAFRVASHRNKQSHKNHIEDDRMTKVQRLLLLILLACRNMDITISFYFPFYKQGCLARFELGPCRPTIYRATTTP